MALTKRTMQRRVNKGFTLLVNKSSLDKVLSINLDKFNLDDPDDCPVGQTLGYYWKQIVQLFNIPQHHWYEDCPQAIACGFDLSCKGTNSRWDEDDEKTLIQCWKEKITRERIKRNIALKKEAKLSPFQNVMTGQQFLFVKLPADILNDKDQIYGCIYDCFIAKAIQRQFGLPRTDVIVGQPEVIFYPDSPKRVKYNMLGEMGRFRLLTKWQQESDFPEDGFLTVVLEKEN